MEAPFNPQWLRSQCATFSPAAPRNGAGFWYPPFHLSQAFQVLPLCPVARERYMSRIFCPVPCHLAMVLFYKRCFCSRPPWLLAGTGTGLQRGGRQHDNYTPGVTSSLGPSAGAEEEEMSLVSPTVCPDSSSTQCTSPPSSHSPSSPELLPLHTSTFSASLLSVAISASPEATGGRGNSLCSRGWGNRRI